MTELKATNDHKSGSWREYLRIILGALILSVLVRTFLFQPFTIPSGSMIPTLRVGDYLFVSKYSYGYSRFSLPFDVPLIPNRLFFSPPRRGDIVVFRSKDNLSIDYVKRVVALPGDILQMKQGILYVNGQPSEHKEIGLCEQSDGQVATMYQEALPSGGGSFVTLKFLAAGPYDNTAPIQVPEGMFFAMGDNRDNSSDSRVFGPVPFKNLVGKAQIVLLSHDKTKGAWWAFWRWPYSIRWNRLLQRV